MLDGVTHGRVDLVGGTESKGRLTLHCQRVDREDARCAGDARALDGGGADTAAADDRDRRARRDLGGVDRRTKAGGEPTPDERELIGRELRLDHDARRFIDRHDVGEAADPAHRVRRRSVGALDALAGHHLGSHLAEMRLVAQTEPALSTDGRERDDHPLPGPQARHLGAHPLDHATRLVPEDHEVAARHAVDHRLVGVAHPTGVDADDGVTGPGREGGDVLEREILTLFYEDGCTHLRTVPRRDAVVLVWRE